MARVTLQPPGEAGPRSVEVELRAAGEQVAFTIAAGEERWTGEATLDARGSGLLRAGRRLLPFHSVRLGDELHLWIDGETYLFSLAAASAGRAAAAGALPPGGRVAAPMPGSVLRVLVEPGQVVEPQAALVIMESMKMELTVAAPAAARVAELLCRPGERVDLGAPLVLLEALP